MNRDELKKAIAIALRSTGGYFLRAHAFQAAEACLSAIEQSGCTICPNDEVSCNRPEQAEQSVSPDKPALQTENVREAEGVVIHWLGGNCPVQSEGTIDGHEYYFRARGEHWSLSVGGEDVIGSPEFYHDEPWGGGPYAAGWMEEDEARRMIAKGAELFRQRAAHSQIEEPRSGDTDPST